MTFVFAAAAVVTVGIVTARVAGGQQPGRAKRDEARRQHAQDFHLRARQPAGLLVPMYVYPGNVTKNPAYQRLIDLKRRYETVPIWVIVNPASGPGAKVDPNYTLTVDRLVGAGCVVLGY